MDEEKYTESDYEEIRIEVPDEDFDEHDAEDARVDEVEKHMNRERRGSGIFSTQ